jgi:hypothetical protein
MKKNKSTVKHIGQSCLAAMGAVAVSGTMALPPAFADAPFNLGIGAGSNARVGSPANKLPDGFSLRLIADGDDPIENPSGVIAQLGILNDAGKTGTEPDENTYLVLDHNPGGPTPGYDYGRHFLFQGHELFSGDLAHVTRINLDVTDPAHRVTLLTPVGADGKTHFNAIDGSVWNPYSRTLLFTQEAGATGGVIEIGADWGSVPRTLYGILGRGGYEGIRPDKRGNLIICEDVGGASVSIDPNNVNGTKAAKNPNSFVYRFAPYDRTDLSKGGKLQALQVSINGNPLTFVPVDAAHPFGDVFSDNQLKLHTLGASWPAKWITIHDTAIDGTADFDSNNLAKTAGATPFKRPENGNFLPGSGFNTYFFDATGDTDARAGNVPALAARGAWGSIFRLDLDGQRDEVDDSDEAGEGLSDTGKISIFTLGDQFHASFDNLFFVDEKTLLAAEDRGDLLHGQLNLLDSVWAYDVRNPNAQAVRFIGLGRDPLSASVANDDNEPTGIIATDGDPSVQQMIGKPANSNDTRIFFTQQHGNNQVWEVLGNAPRH